jgi:flavodoxin
MKILVTYYSQTGNTEKIAKSIFDGCQGQDVDIKPVKEADPASLGDYDLMFLGSGIYASRANKAVTDLIVAAPKLPPKLVLFNTHASLDGYQDGFKIMKEKMGESSEIIAEFDCCGENIGVPEAMIKSMLDRLPEDKRKEQEKHQEWLKGRPNEEDLENAKKFAQSLLEKL